MTTMERPTAWTAPNDDPAATERAIRRVQASRRWAAKRTQLRREARARGEPVRYHRTGEVASLLRQRQQEVAKAALTKRRIAVLLAYAKGYRVDADGVLRNRAGGAPRTRLSHGRRPAYNVAGFRPDDWPTGKNAPRLTFDVVRLAAYQQWGDAVFGAGVYVRYRDGDPQNLRPENLYLTGAIDPHKVLAPPRSGIRAPARGRGGRRPSFTWAQIREFRRLLDSGQTSNRRLATLTGRSAAFFSKLRRNQTYQEVAP